MIHVLHEFYSSSKEKRLTQSFFSFSLMWLTAHTDLTKLSFQFEQSNSPKTFLLHWITVHTFTKTHTIRDTIPFLCHKAVTNIATPSCQRTSKNLTHWGDVCPSDEYYWNKVFSRGETKKETQRFVSGRKRLVELTEILPVSIPKDSLLVSGLKDIQEHSAEDKETNKNSEYSACVSAC